MRTISIAQYSAGSRVHLSVHSSNEKQKTIVTVVFWPVLCVYWWWGQSVWGGSTFQLVRGLQNWVLGEFQAEGAVLTQTFIKSCVDFEVANLSVYMFRLWVKSTWIGNHQQQSCPTLNIKECCGTNWCSQMSITLPRFTSHTHMWGFRDNVYIA